MPRLNTRCLLAAALVAVGVMPMAGCGVPTGDGTRPKPFFFVVAADPQLFWGPLEKWQETIQHVNRLKPAFMVVCGDLVQDPGSDEQAKAYLGAAARLDPSIPLYNAAGNHDVDQSPTPERLAWYEKHFGKPWHSFERGGCLFIVLESGVLNRPENAPELAKQQMAWLRETLEAASQKRYRHIFVFKHYPLCLKAVDEPDQYFTVPQTRRRELLELFHRHGVAAVFSGHYHRNALVQDGALELVTTSSVGKKLGADPLGFRIVKVLADRIEHAYYAFGDLPDAVDLSP